MNSDSIMKFESRSLRAQGKSFREIAKTLKISSSTAHLWTKDIELTVEQKTNLSYRQQEAFQQGRKIAVKAKHEKYIQTENRVKIEAIQEYQAYKKDPLFLTGLALYWAEGFKKDHSLGFVNSDLVMVQLFLKWLTKFGNISPKKIRARVQINQIYSDQINVIEHFWSEALHIPQDQFQTPFFQKSKNDTKFDPKYRGQIRVRAVESREFFVKILTWIQELKEAKEDFG